jgi:uncharacterized protein YcaQ
MGMIRQATDSGDEEGVTLVRRTGRKRGRVARRVLRGLLKRQRKREFEALLAEGYQEMAQETGAMVSESLSLQAAAAEGLWRWDE